MGRLSLISHASTSAVRASAFPADEPLNASGLRSLASLTFPFTETALRLTSPATCAVQTASALRLDAVEEQLLRECDYGRWSGRTIEDIGRTEPEALDAWLNEPSCDAHGGESIEALIARVGGWLDARRGCLGWTIAVTHSAVIRAALVYAIGAGSRSFYRLDIPPLTSATLLNHGGRWNLRSVGPMRL